MTAGGMKMAGRGRVVRRGGVSGCLSVCLSVLRGFAELEAAEHSFSEISDISRPLVESGVVYFEICVHL